MSNYQQLNAAALALRCDAANLAFRTTNELEDFTGMLGQERAVDAICFGVDAQMHGYNLFVHGPEGSGKHSYIRQFLAQRASQEQPASDWCYVNNFTEPHKPRALRLPAGAAADFRLHIARLIEETHQALLSAFESDEYRKRRQRLEASMHSEHEKAITEIREHARKRGLNLQQTMTGFTFIPFHDGKSLTPDEYDELPENKRQQLEKDTREAAEELETVLHRIPRKARELTHHLSELDRQVADAAIADLIDEIIEVYSGNLPVIEHLEDIHQDILDNQQLFLELDNMRSDAIYTQLDGRMHSSQIAQDFPLRRYAVNVLVTHDNSNGAPVIYCENPSHQELLGNIEYRSDMGTLSTDFTLIKAGNLLHANGGYLIIDAYKLLTHPFSWDALKRSLNNEKVRIRSVAQDYGLLNTVSLEPEGIALNAKIILIGDRSIYYLLKLLDPEFGDLFKIAADFDQHMKRSATAEQDYARLLATVARQESLLPLDCNAIAVIIDESIRLANNNQKLSLEMGEVIDILRESHLFARRVNAQCILSDHVLLAIEARRERVGRLREQVQEDMLHNTIRIETTGERIGQLNALAIVALADERFAHPVRLTARVTLGSGGINDIEGEIEMGGPIHSKGMLILSAYVASTYNLGRPLSISASIVFEQSYAGIEGDSASMAELCVLLSALAQAPLKQSFAMTGSVDQFGNVQAIGGVNEKIEGFFALCQARGLDGKQGVIIPAANVRHLMLRSDVVAAVSAGLFNVYSVDHVDAAMELLTGMPAGVVDAAGQFPAGSLNQRVRLALDIYAAQLQQFSADSDRDSRSGH
jgi:predicted ATP-dependent protease